ncbi:MAG TPA: Uma2 family endonuclease [Candidatus Solibacter sp.]|nr:Uma2 family endonuclease [Candidatus Solibacter sp.]
MQLQLRDDAEYRIGSDRLIDDEEFFEFCAENRKLRIEREPNGDITIMPPTGGETSYRNIDLASQLHNWAKRDGRGRAFDSNSEFFLPNGAARGPDAAWVDKGRLANLTKEQKRKFFYLCPDFVIELTSPSDRLNKVQAKMVEWIANGAALGWLIDADKRTVYIYRPGRDPERLVSVEHANGEGPVEGFRLDLTDIWLGL